LCEYFALWAFCEISSLPFAADASAAVISL